MIYNITFSNSSHSDFLKLPKDIQKRIIDKLTKVQIIPFRYFIRLKGRSDYKLRIGDYRLIADINKKENGIEITKIGPRKNIYK